MTPSDFRALLEAACKRPWHWERVVPSCEFPQGLDDEGALTLLAADGEEVLTGLGGEGAGGAWWDIGARSEEDKRLIALAPGMADFLAELAELECDEYVDTGERCPDYGFSLGMSCWPCRARRWLEEQPLTPPPNAT